MSSPTELPDHATGPACVGGQHVALHPLVTRLTATNPSMMTGPGTNTYVVGRDEVVVIDPGPPLRSHLDAVTRLLAGRRVAKVLVTHHHRDHAPAARMLADTVDAPVVGFGHPLSAVDEQAGEGAAWNVDGLELVAWHTPGHASDHLCFLLPSIGWLFTGDHVMQGSTVVIRPPDGDLGAYLMSLARVRDDARLHRLAPGHGRLLASPSLVAEAILEHRQARAAAVAQALVDHGPATAAALRAYAYGDVGPERDAVAVATCWAHLLLLVDEGRATSSGARFDPEAVFASA